MAAILTVPSSVVQLSHAQSNKALQDVLNIHNDERKAVGNSSRSRGATVSQPGPEYGLIIWRRSGSYAVPTPHPGDANLLLPTVLQTRTWLLGSLVPAEFGGNSPAELGPEVGRRKGGI